MDGWLVAYEYGAGAAWGVVAADSAAEIRAHAPEVEVHGEAPTWMSTAELTRLRQDSIPVEELTIDRLFEMSRSVGAALAS